MKKIDQKIVAYRGTKGKQAGYDGDLRPIKTVDDLAWLVF